MTKMKLIKVKELQVFLLKQSLLYIKCLKCFMLLVLHLLSCFLPVINVSINIKVLLDPKD